MATSSAVDLVRTRGYGLGSAKVKEAARLAFERKGRQPDRDSRPRNPAGLFTLGAARSRSGKDRDAAGREDWRNVPLVTIDPPDAKDHDDAVHAEPDSDPNNKGGYIRRCRDRRCRLLCAAGSALDRDALIRAIRCISRTRGADAAGANLQRPLLAVPANRAARSRCGW